MNGDIKDIYQKTKWERILSVQSFQAGVKRAMAA